MMNNVEAIQTADSNPQGREGRILNALLAICLTVGFICFALIALPDQLRSARAFPSIATSTPSPNNISAIVPLSKPKIVMNAPTPANTVRFVPDGSPGVPGSDGNGNAALITGGQEVRVTDEQADALVAGGAGAAMDDAGAETRQALAYSQPKRETNAAPAENPTEFKNAEDAELAMKGQTSAPSSRASDDRPTGSFIKPESKSMAMSSLARRESSALDNERAKQKKSWLITPAGLEVDVSFWRDIYAKYDRNQVLMHHPRYLNIVYDIVDLNDIDKDVRLSDLEKSHMREKRVDDRRDAITAILKNLATAPASSSLTDEELRIKKLFHGVTENDAFRRAAVEDGVRAQNGQRDKFIPGLKYSGRYLGEIEAIFDSYGLPKELTRLIFVESMFNPHAVSSVGASGIFQFMRGTGKLYMSINDIVDERNDPILAAHAAAKLLRHDYEILGAWPLAINAYNTGRGRMQQAVTRMGTTDIGKIIKGFDHPAYGFASRNFFLEFLAALDVAEHAEKYFGPIDYDKPLRYEVVKANYNISLPDVARIASIPLEDLLDMNQALTPRVANGQKLIPIGFSIRVPEKKGELFLAAAARAPQSRSGPVKHTVQDGDTLESVAKIYGVKPQAIFQSNRMVSRRLRPGQTILVPVDGTL